MACVGSDGRPTENGVKMLRAIAAGPKSAEVVAEETDLPLFRVRSGLRELEAAGLASSVGEAYKLTENGEGFIG